METTSPDSGAQPQSKLALNEDCLMWREVEGEVIVLDKRTWTYMGINGSGAVLWTEIAQGSTPRGLVERLRGTYDVDVDVAMRDVDVFLEMLRSHGLLVEGASG